MHRVTNLPLSTINQYLICGLCDGYLIDATTIVECLHSFCRSCILTYLKDNTVCPVCETLLHKTRPHYAIRSDRTLQAIIYKLIPNLFEKEMKCRKQFYRDKSPARVRSLSPEKRGDITLNTYVLQDDDYLSLELCRWAAPVSNICANTDSSLLKSSTPFQPMYLLCSSEVSVGHLQKLLVMKLNLKPSDCTISIFFSSDDRFSADYTLSDVACLYAWRRQEPLKLLYEIKHIDNNRTTGTTDDRLEEQTPADSHGSASTATSTAVRQDNGKDKSPSIKSIGLESTETAKSSSWTFGKSSLYPVPRAAGHSIQT